MPARLLALALALGSVGCVASSDYMEPAHAPLQLDALPDRANIVFVRPSSFASSMLYTILDDRGRFLGDSLPSSYFVTAVPPGDHVFIAWGENTAALRASVYPGRTYYVEVSPRMGWVSSRVQILAIKPSVESWAELPEWLGDSEPLRVDEAGGQSYLIERHEDVVDRISSAREILREYDADELFERTLRPEDGTLPRGVPPSFAPPPPVAPQPLSFLSPMLPPRQVLVLGYPYVGEPVAE